MQTQSQSMASRAADLRVRRKYSFYLSIAALVFTVQLILSFCFHNAFDNNVNKDITFAKIQMSNTKKQEVALAAKDDYGEVEDDSVSNSIQRVSHAKARTNLSTNILNLDELDFRPNCIITRKECISAIHRSQSQKCKQQIANLSCLMDTDEFYPKSLPRYCRYKKIEKKEPRPSIAAKGRKSVKIAFLLSLNGRAARQVKRLIKTLYTSKHFFYIHVDSRQDYLFRELLELESLSNIRLSRKRLSTIWGGASLLKMLLNSISELLSLSNWDYVINLSESDFPVKSIEQLEMFLTANKGSNFVKSHGQETQRFISKQGLDKTFFECDSHMWRLGNRKLPSGIILDGGSDWVALSRPFCEYLIYEKNPLLDGLAKIYEYTLLPAESYFHIVLQNSEFCNTVVDNNLHITNWRRKLGCKCQYKHIVDWCGCSPNDFKPEDWPKLLASTEKASFFARKFEPVVSLEIINRVENWILTKNSAMLETVSFNKYWQNDYHHLDSKNFLNDGRIGVYNIFAVVAKKRMSYMCDENSVERISEDPGATVDSVFIRQVHLFFESDFFKGLIIQFMSSSKANTSTVFEVFVRPLNNLQIKQNSGHAARFINAQICSDYDAKEQIFRNFGCLLNPYSEVGVRHKWLSGAENFSATFVWVDPSYTVAGSFEIKISTVDKSSNSPLILYHKPSFNLPLAPGRWKLLILINWVIIAETNFVIFPFIFYNGNTISKERVKYFHSGPPQLKYINHNFSAVEALLGFKEKKSTHTRILFANSRRFGHDLQRWTETLLQESWLVQDICYISPDSLPCANAHVDSCSATRWSSLFPDPKSEIT